MLSCLLIRYFAATVERKQHPELKSVAFAIVSNSSRPRVLATSLVPKQLGVVPQQTLRQAQCLCPNMEIVRANHEAYERAAQTIADLLLAYTHKVEVEYQPTATAWYVQTISAEELQQLQKVIEAYLGITPTIGVGSNKFVARVASAANSETSPLCIKEGEEAQFLAPYPITLLPLDKEMQRRLPLLGIQTLGQYAVLPRGSVLEQFGKYGRWLHELAKGIDIRPLRSYQPAPKLHQSYAVDDPILNYGVMVNILRQMSELLSHQLHLREAGHITLLLELENGTTLEQHLHPPEAVHTCATLLGHLETLLYRQAISAGISAIKVILIELRERLPKQLSMFDTNENKPSVFDMLPKWQSHYQETGFLQVSIKKTPLCYVPAQQYELRKVASA